MILDRLKDAEARYNLIYEEISAPETAADPEKYAALMKDYKRMTPIIDTYRSYVGAQRELDEARAMLDSPDIEPELREVAEDEVKSLKETLGELEQKLTELLLPRDPNDEKNVVVEIRAGAGGEEAALFAYTLYRMYNMYAERAGFKAELIGANETELGGFKEVSFTLEGSGAYSRLKFESGVHRVQRVPETESSGRIHTSTATVAVLPEAEEVEVEINPADLKIETIKSSGAGGQHINKTESAIRLIHKPSGIVIECQDERSQFKNRDKAMRLLRTRLYEQKRQEQADKIASERKNQVGSGERCERIRTYNYPQGRVTDHRIGLTLHSLESFLNGDIDEILNALAANETAEKLKSSGQSASE